MIGEGVLHHHNTIIVMGDNTAGGTATSQEEPKPVQVRREVVRQELTANKALTYCVRVGVHVESDFPTRHHHPAI